MVHPFSEVPRLTEAGIKAIEDSMPEPIGQGPTYFWCRFRGTDEWFPGCIRLGPAGNKCARLWYWNNPLMTMPACFEDLCKVEWGPVMRTPPLDWSDPDEVKPASRSEQSPPE